MSKFRKVLYSIEEPMYVTLLVLAITSYLGATSIWSVEQSKIIMVATISSMIGILGPFIVEKILKIKFSIIVDIGVGVALLLSVFFGECLQFYYKISSYDKFLHFFGTMMFSMFGYSIAKYFLKKSNNGNHQLLFSLIFGFFFAIAIEAMWEIYEFSFDTIFGTNMQKYIPDEFLDCINESGDYTCSISEIGEFYKTKEGHQYAAIDTMYDIVCDTLGSLCGVLICNLVFKYKPALQDKIIYKPIN